MKKTSLVIPTIFLQAVILLIGIGALALMLWEPQIEGRNAHATVFEIYFKDPFLAYSYLASIPFFVALCQAFKALGYVRQDKTFSQASVKRSEEHTSELQSRRDLVCRLLLEKKKEHRNSS